MRKVAIHQSHTTNPTIEIRADKPMMVKPVILKEYWEDGVRMYKAIDERIFFADKYDEMFLCKVKLKVLSERHKGKNADSTREWMKK